MPNWRNQKKVQSLSLVHSHEGKIKNSYMIQNVMQWGLKWWWRMWVQGIMVLKLEMHENNPLHIQELKLRKKRLWIGGSCWGRVTKFEFVAKTWARRKNSIYKFSQSCARKHLNWAHVSLCCVTLPRGSKMRHHWGNKSKC